jgi:hypothetical protein
MRHSQFIISAHFAGVFGSAFDEAEAFVPLGTYAGQSSFDKSGGSTMASISLKSADRADFRFVSNWDGYDSIDHLEGSCENVAYEVFFRNPPAMTLALGADDECIQALVEKWNAQIQSDVKIQSAPFNFFFTVGNSYIETGYTFGYTIVLDRQLDVSESLLGSIQLPPPGVLKLILPSDLESEESIESDEFTSESLSTEPNIIL